MMQSAVASARRVVVKVGSALVTNDGRGLDREAIEKWAADEFRSTNGQLQWIINEALRKSGRLKKTKKTDTKEE